MINLKIYWSQIKNEHVYALVNSIFSHTLRKKQHWYIASIHANAWMYIISDLSQTMYAFVKLNHIYIYNLWHYTSFPTKLLVPDMLITGVLKTFKTITSDFAIPDADGDS